MKKTIYVLFALLAFLSGCKEAPDYGDAVFMTGTLSTNSVRFLVDGQSSLGLTVTSSAKATSDVKVEVAPAPELLDQYNKTNGTSYQLPPDDSYTFSGRDVTIQTGKTVSTPVEITAESDKLSDGVSYCLPVSITKVDNGGLGILESSRTAYVQFKKVITTKVAQLNGGAWFDVPTFKGESSPVWALNQMTLEIKVRPSALTPEIAESYINPIMGSHESLLLRFGDGSNIPSNKLNFAKVSIGTNYHPDNKPHYESTFEETFENDQWYHIAVVYDGTRVRFYLNGNLEIEMQTQGGQINLAMSYGGHGWDDTFAIGRSYGDHWTYKGCLSECRVWNVARSQSQIQDGMCYVDPTSDGLIAYWRFDGQLQEDGTVLDETGHGHNAHPSGTINWLDNQKCPF
ncbi:MAG: DUF1735 and LamG domain-containing protein [Prevotella sp.]|nr:DUF1735 and LamG domain-containing protein [Prevotella sp.]